MCAKNCGQCACSPCCCMRSSLIFYFGRFMAVEAADCNTSLLSVCPQAGLAARGAEVVRLNTYSTLPVAALPPAALRQARRADVVAFASPSAVKAWLELAGEGARDVAAACIGAALPGTGTRACSVWHGRGVSW